MILVDTDVLIWYLRGYEQAAKVLDRLDGFAISAVTYMELLQDLRDSAELRQLRRAMQLWSAELIAINADISARAVFLVEQYALSHQLAMADALIAATAQHTGYPLLTANDRHYRMVADLELRRFRPAR